MIKKYLKKAFLILGIAFLAMVLKTLFIGGFFKTIRNYNSGKTEFNYTDMAGTEDIAYDSKRQFLLISSSNRWVTMLKHQKPLDGIYALNLNDSLNTMPKKMLTTYSGGFHPHGISVIQQDSSTYVFAVNHNDKGSYVEKFILRYGTLIHLKSFQNDLMFSPNDVAAVTDSTFYVTNDHGAKPGFKQILENYLQLPLSYVLFFDGKNYNKVVDKLKYANGIDLSADKKEVYVATSTGQNLYIYNRDATGDLTLTHYINTHTGIDNITLDNLGNLWLAGHPKLLQFTNHAKDSTKISPSEVIRIHKMPNGIYKQDLIYLNDGSEISGSSVAYKFKNLLFVGDVFQSKLLKVKLDE